MNSLYVITPQSKQILYYIKIITALHGFESNEIASSMVRIAVFTIVMILNEN